MLKKLFSILKKKEEPKVEPVVEVVKKEKEKDEPLVITKEVEALLESIELKGIDELEEEIAKEEKEKKEKGFDVDTSFQFEVYVGLDDESNLELMNDADFETAEEALEFTRKCVKELFNEDEKRRVIAFVHGEHVDERGEKILTRYMI